MRKLISAALLALVVVVFTAAPALALRDPFDPVISQAELTGAGDGGGTGDGGGSGDGTGTGTEDGVNAGGNGGSVTGESGSEGLANTGSDTEPWLVAAYALMAVGAAAVAISKVNSAPTR